jgi:hypothetical protein
MKEVFNRSDTAFEKEAICIKKNISNGYLIK